jgi:hypothetical protein
MNIVIGIYYLDEETSLDPSPVSWDKDGCLQKDIGYIKLSHGHLMERALRSTWFQMSRSIGMSTCPIALTVGTVLRPYSPPFK